MPKQPDRIPRLEWQYLDTVENEVEYGGMSPRDVARMRNAAGEPAADVPVVRKEMIDAEQARRKELAIKQAHLIIDTMTEFLHEQGETNG